MPLPCPSVLRSLEQLFDMIPGNAPNSTVNPRNIQSHIIHIAAAPPDTAVRPQCNGSTALDDVGWESLPAELTKVRIVCSAAAAASS